MLRLRIFLGMLILMLGLAVRADEQRTPPQEALNDLRPGTLTLAELNAAFGKPDSTGAGGLLALYGGDEGGRMYGWFMIENPSYTVPDLAVETPPNSTRVDLVMAIGYDGLTTERGVACFQSESRMLEVYGKPDFVFAVPMQGVVLYEFYYVDLGISFDLAAIGATPERSIVAIYVTYPEYLRHAIELRREFIRQGVGRDVTSRYTGGGQEV